MHLCLSLLSPFSECLLPVSCPLGGGFVCVDGRWEVDFGVDGRGTAAHVVRVVHVLMRQIPRHHPMD